MPVAVRRLGAIVLFGLVPVLLTLGALAVNFDRSAFLYDFHGGLYDAGRAIIHGLSPYRDVFVAHQAAIMRAGGTPASIDVPVYPPPILLAALPFSLLTYKLAALVYTAASLGALVLALRLVGVRDWRCYGAALLSWPILSGFILGAVNPWLLLLIALAWRQRSQAAACGAWVTAAIIGKIFPWTLGAWLLVTRRYRALAVAIVVGVVALLATWAVIDFHGMTAYPHMLSQLSYLQRSTGVSVVAGLLSAGASPTLAQAGAFFVTGLLVLGALRVAPKPGGDARALGLVLIAALAASPNVWPHYFALLLIPIALTSRRFSPLWLLPLVTDLAPVDQAYGHALQLLPYYAVEVLLAPLREMRRL